MNRHHDDAGQARASEAGRGIGHGKVILFGEHAVVHGCPALAMALSKGAHAQAAEDAVDQLDVAPFGTRITLRQASAVEGEHAQLAEAFSTALSDTPAGRPPLRVSATLEVPAGAGLGASAALGVAIARAVDSALGRRRSDAEVAEASLRWERVFHGNPSGVDSAMAAGGGFALFRRGESLQTVSASPLPLVVGHSGQAPSTRAMVDSVARQLENDPKKVRGIFDAIETLVLNGRTALQRGDLRALGQLMTLNQQLLNTLLLSTVRLEEMCQAATDAGALGAKLTGGGGGGCMIALAPDFDHAEQIAQTLRTRFAAEAFVATPAQQLEETPQGASNQP